MNHHLYVIQCWLNEIDSSYSMQLLSCLLEMKVQRDVVLPQILCLEVRRVYLTVEVIKDHDPP